MDPHIMLQSVFRNPLLRALLYLAILAPASATAQEAEGPGEATPWYQIEVLIFANDDPYAAGPERWPDDVELSYPQRIVALATTPAPGLGNTSGAISRPPLATNTSASATSLSPPPLPDPFIALDQDELQLSEVAARILRQRDFRLLFHRAWRQPTSNRDDSISLLVRGGDSFEDHRELEGWIQLSVERYLHFRTDLWLSSFRSTAGMDTLPWPKLPRLPVLSLDQSLAPDGAQTQKSFGAETGELMDDSLSDLAGSLQMPAFSVTGRRYVVDKTVVLRQSRRMRSDELHYIDHPLMGILVKVTPYEIPTTETAEALSAMGESSIPLNGPATSVSGSQ